MNCSLSAAAGAERKKRAMKKKEIFLLPVPAEGHLTSMLDMASRLLHHSRDLSVVVLLTATPIPGLVTNPAKAIKSMASSGLDIRFEELPPVEPSLHPPTTQEPGSGAAISQFVAIYKPHVKAALARGTGAVGIVIDFFATAMIDVAHELGLPAYVYFTSGAATLALMLSMPALHENKRLPVDLDEAHQEAIEVPGMSPVPPFHMPMSVLSHRVETYTSFLHHGRRFREARGIIVNTFAELEQPALQAIEEGLCVPDHPTPLVYAIGPVIRTGARNRAAAERHECIRWLDEQPPASVVFMCFGSGGSFSGDQMEEMAAALENSGHRFLWSARISSAVGKFGAPSPDLEEIFPEGFLERTKGRGLVWPAPVPQVEILAHEAVGGFVTHCGWNSSLESLWFGVPMLAWPLYAEQHFIALRLVRDLGVAVELKVDRRNGNYVSAEELERGLRCLMEDSEEGKKVRRRAQAMKVASRKAEEEGGSSFASLDRLAHELLKA